MEVLQYSERLSCFAGATLRFRVGLEGAALVAREQRSGLRVPLFAHAPGAALAQCFACFQPRVGLRLFPRLLGGGLCVSRDSPLADKEIDRFLGLPGDPFDYAHRKAHVPVNNQLTAVAIANNLAALAKAGQVHGMRLAELEDIPQVSVALPFHVVQSLLTALNQPALWAIPNAYLVRFHLTRLARRYLTDHIFQHHDTFFQADVSDLKAQIEDLLRLASNRDREWPESGSLMQLTLMSRLLTVDRDPEEWWKAVFRHCPTLFEPYTSLYPVEVPPHLANLCDSSTPSLIGKKHLFEVILLLDSVYFALGSRRCSSRLRAKAITALAELLASRDDFTVTYMALACFEWAMHRGKLDEAELRRLGVLVEDLLNASTLALNFRLCEVLASLLVRLRKSDQLLHLLDRATFQQLEFDQRVVRLLSLPPAELWVEPPYWNLPPLQTLVGRETELDDARSVLLTRRVVTIAGPQGVGKTALACSLAAQLSNGYYIVWLCDARTETTLSASCLSLASRLGCDSVQSVLAVLNSPKVLLILDNLSHSLTSQFQALVGSQAYVLVTAATSPEFAVQLTALSSESALQYLTTATGRASDRNELMQLAQAVGGLPIALHLCAQLLRTESVHSLLTFVQGSPETSPERTTTALQLMTRFIQQASDPARILLQLVALVVPEGLSLALIAPLFALLQPQALIQTAIEELTANELLLEQESGAVTVPALVRTTLESCTPRNLRRSLNEHFISILLERFDPDRVAPKRQELTQAVVHMAAYVQTQEEVTEAMFQLTVRHLEHSMKVNGVFKEVEPMFRVCVGWYEEFFQQSPQAGEYLSSFARIVLLAGQYAQAEAYAENALSLISSQQSCKALVTLATALQVQGRLAEAEKVVTCALQLQPAASVSTAQATLVQATILLTRKNAREAETLALRSLCALEKAMGAEHPDLAPALLLLSSISQTLGRTSEAESLATRCLDLLEPAVGPRHPLLASTCQILAELYQAQQRLPEAEQCCLRAFRIQQLLYGDTHPLLTPVLGSLASLYQALGQLSEAETYARARIAVQEVDSQSAVLGPLYFELAELLYAQSKFPDAEHFALKALQAQEAALPRAHPQFAASYSLLAAIYLARQKPEQAEKFALDALFTQEALFGKNEPEVAGCYALLAAICVAQSRLQDALDFAKDVIRIRKKAVGKRHSDLARHYLNAGEICVKSEKWAEAEKLALKAVRLLESSKSPLKSQAFSLLTSVYMAQNRLSDAEKYYLEALALAESARPDNVHELAVGYQSLASVCQAQGKIREAGRYAIKARQLFQ